MFSYNLNVGEIFMESINLRQQLLLRFKYSTLNAYQYFIFISSFYLTYTSFQIIKWGKIFFILQSRPILLFQKLTNDMLNEL